MRIAGIRFPQFDLTAKILLWGFVCALIFLLAAHAAWIQQGNGLVQSTEHDIDASLAGFEARLDDRSADLDDLAKWLDKQPDFVNSLGSGDSATLARSLAGLTAAGIVDTATVTDGQGNTLARVSQNLPASHGDSILGEPGIRQGLAGQTLLGLRKDDFNLVQSLILPVRTGEQNPPIGVLRLGFYLDDGYLSDASPGSAQPPYYLAEGGTVTLLGDPQHESVLSSTMPPESIASWRQGRASGFVTLQTVNGPYLFEFRPFHSLDPNLIAAYGTGVPLDAVQAAPSGLDAYLGLASLALVALTCAAGFYFHRRYSDPLRRLKEASQRIGGGEPVTISMSDADLDGLGEQINKMHARLSRSVRSLTAEMSRRDAILQSLGAAFIVTDPDDRIVDLNPATELLVKQEKAKLLGQEWRDIFIGSKRGDEGPGLFQEAEGTESGNGEFDSAQHGRFALRQDPTILLNALSKPFDVDGRASGYVHVLENASEQEQFARSRNEFMMNAAHELRSPLVSLRTSVELLNEEQMLLNKQELNFMLRNMRRSVIRFEAFVENLIDVGNIIAGRFMVRPIPTLLEEVVDAARSQVEPLLEAKGQSLSVRSNCQEPCRVFADPSRITQVMVNLLSSN